MEQQETINRLDKIMVSEFMGEKWIESRNSNSDTSLPFDTSWDWLMPVVKKIESLGFVVEITSIFCYIYKKPAKYNYHVNMVGDDKIDATLKAVVEFIKWYNSQN